MRTDKQTFLSSAAAGFQVVDQTGNKSYFEYSFTFTPANWDDWVVINVSANPAFAGTDSVLKAFPPQDQNLEQIRGPLIIEGGLGSAGADRSLRAPVLLPNETNSVERPGSQQPGERARRHRHAERVPHGQHRRRRRPAVLPHDRRRRPLDPQRRPRAHRLRDGRRPRGEPGHSRVLRISSISAAASPTTASRSSKSCSARATRR